jgi:WD40 repeat protein
MRNRGMLVAVGVAVLVVLASACTATVRVSVGANGESNGSSFLPAVDGSGRFVAFRSSATNLAAGDTNGHEDVFVRDTRNDVTSLVSRSTNGTLGNGDSTEPEISANGQFVLFSSDASNFVAGDDNDASDVFLRDRHAHTTRLVSRATDGTVADGPSHAAALSADGTKAVFTSFADDIVTGASGSQVYIADLTTGAVRRISSPALCPYHDGYVVLQVGATGDASHVAYAAKCTAGPYDTFPIRSALIVVARDVAARRNTVAWSFAYQSDPSEEFNINSLSFAAGGSQLAWNVDDEIGIHNDVFTPYIWSPSSVQARVLDLPDEPTSLSLSPDGTRVAYTWPLPDYLSGLPHARIKLFDIPSSNTYEVTVPIDGPAFEHPDGDSARPTFSGDGAQLVWDSNAGDLVPGDTNGASDVFTRPISDVTGGGGDARRVSG